MSGVLRRIWSFAFTLLLVSAPRCVQGATLEWNGTPDCTSDAFELKFEQVSERRLHQAPGRAVHVFVRQEGADTWTLQVSIAHDANEPATSRALRGFTCTDVSHAAAVAVAMALFDELPIKAESEPKESVARAPLRDEDASNTKPANLSSKEAHVPSKPLASTPWQVPVFALAVLDGGLLGDVALGWRVGFALSRANWEVGLSYAAVPFVTKAVEANLNVELAAHTGVFGGCYLFGAAPVRPTLCVNYEAGVLIGEGSGLRLTTTRRQVTFWHGVRPEVALYVNLSSALDVRFAVGPTFGLNRAQFVLDENRVAHDVQVFSVRGCVGLAWSF